MNRRIRLAVKVTLIVFGLFFMPVGCMVVAHVGDNLTDSRRTNYYGSTQQAPSADSDEAVIQVYAARAARWRGAFGVHTWIAVKRTDERHYTRLEVMGYRAYWGGNPVRIRRGAPDDMWYGSYPVLLREIRGDRQVDALIDTLLTAANTYPYDETYHVWPGPNSNTFIAYLGRHVPQLRLELPSTAIGKDYLPKGAIFGSTPSGKGVQISLRGYAGVLAGLEEGLEINLLGLTAGIDLWPPALKLPGIGRMGMSDTRRVVLSADAVPDTTVTGD